MSEPELETEDFTDDKIGPVKNDVAGGPGRAVDPTGTGFEVRGAGHREETRRWLAMALVGLFSGVTVLAMLAVVFDWTDVGNVKSLLEVIVPPIVALTGSALGFYFGVERTPPS
jgi:hypothetical protein